MSARNLSLLALLLLALGLAFLFLNIEGEDRNVPSLAIPLEAPLQTLDPARLSDPVSSKVIWAVYEGLVGLDEDNEVVPLIAESWVSNSDWTSWSFKIRKGVLFHPHGAFGTNSEREVTAQDVLYSYERLGRGFGSFLFQGLIEGFDDYTSKKNDHISGIRLINQFEIAFDLTRPDPSFIHRISSPYLSIMPQEVVEADPEAFSIDTASGTGPFLLESVSPTHIVLKRNLQYWRETMGNVEVLRFEVQPNALFRYQGFRSGKFDIIEVPPEYAENFAESKASSKQDPAINMVSRDTFNVHYLGFDVEKISDKNLRLLVQQSIDRDQIVKSLLYRSAIPWPSAVPPGMQGYVSTVNVAAKKQVNVTSEQLDVAGRFELLVNGDSPTHTDIAQVVQSQLSKSGIKVDINVVDFNAFVTRLFSDDRPPFFIGYSEWVYSAPELVMGQFLSSAVPNPNMFQYKESSVDQLIAKFSSTSDREELNAICSDLESLVMENPPAVWLYHMIHNFALGSGVKGFAVTGNNHWLLEDVRVSGE